MIGVFVCSRVSGRAGVVGGSTLPSALLSLSCHFCQAGVQKRKKGKKEEETFTTDLLAVPLIWYIQIIQAMCLYNH